jgi:hypothetical protein
MDMNSKRRSSGIGTADISRRRMLQGAVELAGLAGILAHGRNAAAAQAATPAAFEYPKKYLWDVKVPWDPAPRDQPRTLRERLPEAGKPSFDLERLINSPQGEALVSNFELYITRFTRSMDPEVLDYYAKLEKGLKKEMFGSGDERWSCYTPLSMYRRAGKGRKYPLMIIVHGGTGQIEFEEANGFLRLAARDEVIVIAPMNQEENNMLRVLSEVKSRYPVDEGRVYAMGYSNGGSHTNLVTTMRPDLFAAAAPSPRPFVLLGSDEQNLAYFSDEAIENFRRYTLPMVCVGGLEEYNYYYPINQDPVEIKTNTAISAKLKIELVRRRLRMMRCRVPEPEEFHAMAGSEDIAKRNMGVPFDRTSVQTILGLKHWIGDFRNDAGDYCFRMVCIENMPHFLHPTTPDLIWSYIRRFSRDTRTKKLVVARS